MRDAASAVERAKPDKAQAIAQVLIGRRAGLDPPMPVVESRNPRHRGARYWRPGRDLARKRRRRLRISKAGSGDAAMTARALFAAEIAASAPVGGAERGSRVSTASRRVLRAYLGPFAPCAAAGSRRRRHHNPRCRRRRGAR